MSYVVAYENARRRLAAAELVAGDRLESAVELAHDAGLSCKEIAVLLEVPKATVRRVYYARVADPARDRRRQLIDDDEYEQAQQAAWRHDPILWEPSSSEVGTIDLATAPITQSGGWREALADIWHGVWLGARRVDRPTIN